MEIEKIFKALSPESSIVENGKITYRYKYTNRSKLLNETARGKDIEKTFNLYGIIIDFIINYRRNTQNNIYPPFKEIQKEFPELTIKDYSRILIMLSFLRF